MKSQKHSSKCSNKKFRVVSWSPGLKKIADEKSLKFFEFVALKMKREACQISMVTFMKTTDLCQFSDENLNYLSQKEEARNKFTLSFTEKNLFLHVKSFHLFASVFLNGLLNTQFCYLPKSALVKHIQHEYQELRLLVLIPNKMSLSRF